jgi:formylglycine-generating enzyme required for sulfatase activity
LRRVAALAGWALVAACAGDVPAPHGEVLIVVDTDLPAPRFAARLRIDVHSLDGAWLDSRDVARVSAREWPASFGAYTLDDEAPRDVLVRLRAYPEGKLRDAPAGGPRRIVDGVDLTPEFEPLPALSIDRISLIHVEPRRVTTAYVTLHGACLGIEADLGAPRSCLDGGELVELAPEPTVEGKPTAPASESGSFPRLPPCSAPPRPAGVRADGTPLWDEEVCVPGGLVIFGSEAVLGWGEGGAVPERAALIPPLRVDRYEVTVARWRQALEDGFVPPRAGETAGDLPPVDANEGPLAATSSAAESALCTFSEHPRDREDYALTCVDWDAARELCRFRGGDLPTEAQWEYLASAAVPPFDRSFPWGTAPLDCARAVYGRWDLDGRGGSECHEQSGEFGPLPVHARAGPDGDVTPEHGIVGLGGGVAEWVRDELMPLSSACWRTRPLDDPLCEGGDPALRSHRGGHWADSAWFVGVGFRDGLPPTSSHAATVGFRCVRPGTE